MSATLRQEVNTGGSESPLIAVPNSEIATPDFISAYADYADVFEMPRQVHEWMAAQLIASVLNGKVWIEWGARYPLDLWVLLLSGSGQGRNTATDVALGVIEKADIPNLVHKATWGSKVAFYQQLAESPKGLYVWPELSVALKTLNDPRFAGIKEWITDRYDNLRIPDAIVYRKANKKNDTPPIEFGEAPRINIIATSSSDWFIQNLEQADTTGGFIPRWLPKQVGKSEKVIPKPVSPDPDLLPPLVDQLNSIASLEGTADFSKVEDQYNQWYAAAKKRFSDQPNSSLADPFFGRLRGELLKLALIFEVSQSGTLRMTDSAFKRALAVVKDAEETIVKLLPSEMTREGTEVERMAQKIYGAGAEGITQSELTRAFQYWDRRNREARLQTLLESRRVEVKSQPTTGRAVTRYVHEDHSGESESAS
jgi:hypothetical protein